MGNRPSASIFVGWELDDLPKNIIRIDDKVFKTIREISEYVNITKIVDQSIYEILYMFDGKRNAFNWWWFPSFDSSEASGFGAKITETDDWSYLEIDPEKLRVAIIDARHDFIEGFINKYDIWTEEFREAILTKEPKMYLVTEYG